MLYPKLSKSFKSFKSFKKLTLLCSIVVLTACGTPVRYEGVKTSGYGLTEAVTLDAATRVSINKLAKALKALNPKVTTSDASILAREAHLYPMYLANVWNVSSPPLINNYLRNSGKREYGLCIDWAYAMRQRMRGLNLNSFDWHWGIANQGSEWREHSTLVATAKGAKFDQGIVLDPWRNSGKLFWSGAKADPSYEWKAYTEPSGWTPSRLDSF
jgi:hypothetical protein